MLVCPDKTTEFLGVPENSTDSLDFKWGFILMVRSWEERGSPIGFLMKVFDLATVEKGNLRLKQ